MDKIGYTVRMDRLPEDSLKDVLINPYYAVTFETHIFKQHSEGPKEDWVAANVHLISDIGTESWMNELLHVLSQPRAKYDGHDIINPTAVINVSDRLQGEHEPLVSCEQWIQANTKMVGELGADNWLWHLLRILETGGVSNDIGLTD